ncbi:MAG: 16S rRNA (guanine(527)-N(7))-methyltransferase RsmG [Flavobacteriaceae bacterium]|nr:16S rRNA (guanine(527)-N(7))-methyltransferase RsmG [Flavobacteriaceae bacterium]
MNIIEHYFPNLSDRKKKQFTQLESLYGEWNEKINVISRKDIAELYERHVLHSISIALLIEFAPGSQILDVGTGGGFPGIPLAILFPQVDFYLIDSIGKKIKVVQEITNALDLRNIEARHQRAQEFKRPVDFVVSRAVTKMDDFVPWVKKNIAKKSKHNLPNGILYLKGGDLNEELKSFPKATVFPLSDFFEEPFFETKKIVHVPLVKKP